MAFYWVYESAEDKRLGHSEPFDSRSDAETWIGAEFNLLLDEQVDQVRLFEDETEIFGPMSLHP
mgnify:FL=1